MWEIIKNNPWKVFAGSTGTLILTVGGFFITDARYVHMSYARDQHISLDLRIQALKKEVELLREELKAHK